MSGSVRSDFKKIVGRMFQVPTDEVHTCATTSTLNKHSLTTMQVNDSLKFKEDLGAGPEEMEQLVSMGETEFGAKFADGAAENLKTGKSGCVAPGRCTDI